MGCSLSRNNLHPVEETIQIGENSLLYSSHKVQELDLIFRKYSYSGEINPNQLLHIQEELGLAQKASEKDKFKIKEFYDLFKVANNYSLSELICLSILLSSDNQSIKARLLFEAFDTLHSHYLNKEVIENIFEVIYSISVIRIQKLVEGVKNDEISESEKFEYFQMLESGKENFKRKFLMILLKSNKDRLGIEQFVDVFKNFEHNKWITSYGFREALKDNSSKRKPVKFNELFDSESCNASDTEKKEKVLKPNSKNDLKHETAIPEPVNEKEKTTKIYDSGFEIEIHN